LETYRALYANRAGCLSNSSGVRTRVDGERFRTSCSDVDYTERSDRSGGRVVVFDGDVIAISCCTNNRKGGVDNNSRGRRSSASRCGQPDIEGT